MQRILADYPVVAMVSADLLTHRAFNRAREPQRRFPMVVAEQDRRSHCPRGLGVSVCPVDRVPSRHRQSAVVPSSLAVRVVHVKDQEVPYPRRIYTQVRPRQRGFHVADNQPLRVVRVRLRAVRRARQLESREHGMLARVCNHGGCFRLCFRYESVTSCSANGKRAVDALRRVGGTRALTEAENRATDAQGAF